MRNDFNFNYYPDYGKAEQYNKELKQNRYIHKIETLGALDIYQFNNFTQLFDSDVAISYQEINPTKYKVFLKGIGSNAEVVFAESFHPDWRLYINNNQTYAGYFDFRDIGYLIKASQFGATHHVANDYINGWTINSTYIKQNFDRSYYRENPDGSIDIEMTLFFQPQSYFYLGFIISGVTLIGCLGYLGWDLMKRRTGSREDLEEIKKLVEEQKHD